MLVVLPIGLLLNDFVYTFIFSWCFYLLYLRNILCTKIFDCDIWISDFPISHISLNYSFLLKIPWNLILSSLAVSPATYVHDLCILALLIYLLLSIYIIFSVSFPLLLFYQLKKLFFCISARILYDIYNSISYVIKYVYHSFWMSSFWCSHSSC